MQSTLTHSAFNRDGTLVSTKTTRHPDGFRLDQFVVNVHPFDAVAVSYTDTNDQQAIVRTPEGHVIATYLLVKDQE